MNRTEKAAFIERIKEAAEAANIAILADFKGMPVEEMTRLRADVRESGGEVIVVKNTLARIALTGTQYEAMTGLLTENCAFAFGKEDSIATTKATVEFAKKSKTLKIRKGCLDGSLLEPAQLEELSKLPSREELLAKTLGTLNAVPTNFVSLLANTIRGLLNVLNAIEQDKAA